MEVRIRGLRKSYPQFVLSIPEEDFPSGSITAVTGPNGKGKTTLMRILAGLEGDFTGVVAYDGKPLDRQIRLSMTMTFQTPMLLDRTVYANIEYPLKIRGIAREERKAHVDKLLDMLSIGHVAKKNARKLSGGESQKAALARGLSLEPRLLLLDEPFSAIDRQSIDDMMDCIADYNQRTGATVILVSHDDTQIKRLCSRIVIL
jgi:tungstate transport system ATP-binding protein